MGSASIVQQVSKLCRRRGSLAHFSSRGTAAIPATSSSQPILQQANVSSLFTRSFSTAKVLWRSISQLIPASNGSDRLLLIDTFALARKLELQGFDAKQAEAISAAMTDVLNDCLQNVSDSVVSKAELEQYNFMQDAAFAKLQSDVQTSQEKKVSSIKKESEKLRVDIQKLQSEIRFEIDKVSAGKRLDLNLERNRIKEELTHQSDETTNLTNKLDNEINALKKQLEASKYEVIRYCIGTIVSVYALGLALLRIFK